MADTAENPTVREGASAPTAPTAAPATVPAAGPATVPAAVVAAAVPHPVPAAPQPSLLVATEGTLPSPDGVRRPRPLVRRRVLFDAKTLEGIFDRVLTRLPNAVNAGVEPLRAELAAARTALEEQSRLRMQAEARAISAERELEFLRAQIAEAAARPAGLFRRRPQPVFVPQT